MNAKTPTTPDSGFGYTLTRELDTSVTKAWQAWTTPEQYAEWASAKPGSVEFDVRPGGVWKSVMVTPGGDFPLTGSYVEVVENRRLVVGMDVPGRPEPATMAVDFEAHGEQARIVLSQTCDTEQERDLAEQGSNVLLDGLTAFLAET